MFNIEYRVMVLPGGKVQIFIDGDGLSFEDAAKATKDLLADFQAAGIPVEMIGVPEQHKAGVEHVHVQQTVRHQH